jgi:hypothetical protein
MTGLQAKFKQYFHPILSVSLVLSFSLGITSANVLAKTKSGVRTATARNKLYRPPTNVTSPKTTSAGGTRTDRCEKLTNEDSLTALAPIDHNGQSIANRPTFVWYVSDQKTYPVIFQLWNADEERLYQVKLQSRPGLMQLSWPIDQPELQPGVKYHWRVVLVCDSGSPSRNVNIETMLEIVEPSGELQAELSKTQDPIRQIELYAQNGLWYDALALAVSHDQPLNDSSIALDLLESLDLPEGQKNWRDRWELMRKHR